MDENSVPAFGSLLRARMQQQLEERVLELIDFLPEKTDPNILEYISLAEREGFSTIAEFLREIVFEIGKAQIQTMNTPRRQSSTAEKSLEDFLAAGNNLEQIEGGLRYSGRQRVIASGRLDITAQDQEGKPVIIELKMNEYKPYRVDTQLRKYLGEYPEARLIFVAPTIKPELVFSLRDLVDANRISFYQVERDGIQYSFSPVSVDDFTSPNLEEKVLFPDSLQNDNPSKTPPPTQNIIKVVRGSSKPSPKKVEDYSEQNAEQKITIQNFRDLPIYLRILLMNDLDENYLGTRERSQAEQLVLAEHERLILYNMQVAVANQKVNERQWKQLQKMAYNTTLERRLELYAEAIPHLEDPKATEREIMDSKDYFLKSIRDRYPNQKHQLRQIHEWMVYNVRARLEFENNFMAVFQTLQKLPFAELESREKVQAGFDQFAQQYQKLHQGVIRTRNKPGRQEVLTALAESLKKCPADIYPILEETLYLSNGAYEAAVDSFFGLKKERTKLLLDINPVLGIAYLSFDFITLRMIQLFPNYPRPIGALEFSYQECLEYFRQDTEVYEEMIDMLRPEQSYSPTAPGELRLLEQIVVRTDIDPAEIPTDLPPTINYLRTKLLSAIMLPAEERFSEDNQARIQYFVDDVLANGYDPAKMEELAARLEEFNLKRRLRRVEDRPKDIGMRNFFDDIMLKYVQRNTVPTILDLEKLYMAA